MAHIHELIDWTAGVYIVHGNKVLMRLHEKYKIWVHVGGHVELNEDPVTAAIRECKEEVGLDVTIYDPSTPPPSMRPGNKHLPLPMHMNIHFVGDNGHQHCDLLYYATCESTEVTPENTDDQWEWLTKEEIEAHENIVPQIKFYAQSALATLGSK